MDKANRSGVLSTTDKRSDREGRRFGQGMSGAKKRRRWSERKRDRPRKRRHGAFARRPDFRRDPDLIWFFQQVGKDGQKRLRSKHDLRRWSRLKDAVGGLWRLCLYFTNPRGFARPLVAALVNDVSDYGAGARHLYGLSPDERATLFRKEEKEIESRKCYAMPARQDFDPSAEAGLQILEKEYTEYLRRRATSARRPPEVIVSSEVLNRLVPSQFEYRRRGEYPTVDTTANVIADCRRFGYITWSTWGDYAINPHAARTILHKRRVLGVEDMSDLQLVRKLEDVVAEETRKLEEERAEEAEAREAKAARARVARRRPTMSDWFSSTLALDHTVAQIAQAARLPQRRVRDLLVAQGCPGITLAEGDPPERWLDSDAGHAFKAALAAAVDERRQVDAARRA